MKERVQLADGFVHRRGHDGTTCCGQQIPKHTHGTIAVTTCAPCIQSPAPEPRKVGRPRIADEDEFIDVDLRCTCGSFESRRVHGDVKMSALTCGSCGRLGLMKITSAPPPSPEDRELPPGPEV